MRHNLNDIQLNTKHNLIQHTMQRKYEITQNNIFFMLDQYLIRKISNMKDT